LITVQAADVDEKGFFCYKSKRRSDGYRNKLMWVKDRLSEGMVIKMVYENGRSVGFIEYLPGEAAWRAVEAPQHLVVHCLWVVGRAKEKGYGSWLLRECVEDAARMGKVGVVMVSTKDVWLADERIFLKNGFEKLEEAPPSFDLLVKSLRYGPQPSFPRDWEARAARYGSGATVLYTDQCPYIPDAVEHARATFVDRGIETRIVKMRTAADVRAFSPSAYGIFGIVLNGSLFSYHYLGKKDIRRLDERLQAR
jgi:GNAT superfamily N-acetyltransferase